MKVKARYILIVFLIFVLYLYFSGYRFTPRQAANAHSFLESDAQIISDVDVGWGHAYIYKVSDYYLTVMATKRGFLWRAPGSTHTRDIKDNNDKIKTIGWMSFTNNKHQIATILVIENKDENVVSIEAGKETQRNKKSIGAGELLTFVWDEVLFSHDINPVALSKDNRELYRYGHPLGKTTFSYKELKWYSIPDLVNETFEQTIEKKLNNITNPKSNEVSVSSNPYDYIKTGDRKEDYEYIVSQGEKSLNYMLNKFENSDSNGLQEYIMAIACSEILKEDTASKSWTNGREWYENYSKANK